jgi:hypothetical protein
VWWALEVFICSFGRKIGRWKIVRANRHLIRSLHVYYYSVEKESLAKIT